DLDFQVARGLRGDRHAVRQRVHELVGTEAARATRREQDPDDAQAFCFCCCPCGGISQAEGSKRRAGLAAQEGSVTPWRTAVISAMIATAISGGVLEPIYRPTGPRRRAISPSDRSNSLRRTRRASLFFFEPMAPT